MSIVGDIPYSFHVDERTHDYVVHVSVKGRDVEGKLEILNSVVFEVEEGKYHFAGLPIENNIGSMSRTIFVKRSS